MKYRIFTLDSVIGMNTDDPEIAGRLEGTLAECTRILEQETGWDDWRLVTIDWGQAVFEHP